MPSFVLILLIVLAAAVLLAVDALVAAEFYKAASAKGWGQKKYFWLAFFSELCRLYPHCRSARQGRPADVRSDKRRAAGALSA